MNGIYGGMGAGAWIVMAVVWIALIALVVWAVATLATRTPRREGPSAPGERPEEIPDRRLATGEIDSATYDSLLSKLRSAHAAKG